MLLVEKNNIKIQQFCELTSTKQRDSENIPLKIYMLCSSIKHANKLTQLRKSSKIRWYSKKTKSLSVFIYTEI